MLGPFIRIVLTTLEAGRISFLAWCQWRSWAWRVKSEFLHVFRSDISALPPFPCPSPLYPLYAHLALIFVLLSMCGLIRSAIILVNLIRDFKSCVDFQFLSSLLMSLVISHFLQLRILDNRIL